MASNDRKYMPRVTIEGAVLRFKNFAGEARRYNEKGKRNFVIFLDPDVAMDMEKDGWNVKWLEPREEGEIKQPMLKVNVRFDGRIPPSVVLVSSRGRTNLGENEVEILDTMPAENVDLIINPYERVEDGVRTVTAYLHKIFYTIREDELDLKYANVPDVVQREMADDTWDE